MARRGLVDQPDLLEKWSNGRRDQIWAYSQARIKKSGKLVVVSVFFLLLMEEILHHLGCMKPCIYK